MDTLLEAFVGALKENPLIALVIILVFGNIFLGLVSKRLFSLYVTVMEKRIEEANASRNAIAENTRAMERMADILKVSLK